MKKRSFLMAAFAAMFMASCSDNDLTQENGSQIAEKDGQVYMKVSIANPRGVETRGDTRKYENGNDPTETFINKILFAFYNDNGNLMGTSPMTYANKTDNELGDTEFGKGESLTTGGNVEQKLSMVVPVDLKSGNPYPTSVVAYVNPVKNDHSEAQNLKEIVTLTREAGNYVNGDGNFVMNNSVYFDGDNKLTCAVPLTLEHFHATREDAKKTEAKEVVIRVERMAAKVKVSTADGLDLGKNLDGSVANKDMQIKFNPVGWTLNATAKKSYLVKQFRKGTGDATKTDVDNRFGTTGFQWNVSGDYRSYWCTAWQYTFDNYPKVASQVGNVGTTENPLPVTYLRYNEAIDNKNKKNWGESMYCFEHTVTNASASLAAYTSVIVVGYYTLDGVETATDFYTYGESVPAEGESPKPIVYKSATELIKKMAENYNIIYTKKANVTGTTNADFIQVTGDALANVYQLSHPENTDIIGNSLVPSRYVYLQVNPEIETETYWYKKGENDFEQITTDNHLAINKLLFENSDAPATKFQEGAVYYNIPIEQFGKKDNKDVVYGTYGVVRNHAYNIIINDISGLGTAIGDKEDVIVPPTSEQKYYVKTTLEVLAWNVLPDQGVTLGE